MENCFDNYTGNEIKLIKTKMYSAGKDGLSYKYYGKYESNREVVMAVDIITIIFSLFALILLILFRCLICKYNSCKLLNRYG